MPAKNSARPPATKKTAARSGTATRHQRDAAPAKPKAPGKAAGKAAGN